MRFTGNNDESWCSYFQGAKKYQEFEGYITPSVNISFEKLNTCATIKIFEEQQSTPNEMEAVSLPALDNLDQMSCEQSVTVSDHEMNYEAEGEC